MKRWEDLVRESFFFLLLLLFCLSFFPRTAKKKKKLETLKQKFENPKTLSFSDPDLRWTSDGRRQDAGLVRRASGEEEFDAEKEE